MRLRAIFHCTVVFGCSGKALDVEEGKGFLFLSGVIFVENFANCCLLN